VQHRSDTFPNRWIGHGSTINWPPRSPVLAPLDFCLWGWMKRKVYWRKVDTRDEIPDHVMDVIAGGYVALWRGTDAVGARSSAWCTGIVRAGRWWCPLLRRTGGPAARLRGRTCPLAVDAGQEKLLLGLGEPHGWPLGPERREPHGHSRYLRWRWAVCSLHASSGSPMWDGGIHSDNHVHLRNRPAKTSPEKGRLVPSRVRLLDTGRSVLRSG
jgi:hypothetical protein